MKWLRALPMAAWGALVALAVFAIRWLRNDAARDALKDQEIKDKERAHEIADRVRRDTTDPERLHHFDEAGYRD